MEWYAYADAFVCLLNPLMNNTLLIQPIKKLKKPIIYLSCPVNYASVGDVCDKAMIHSQQEDPIIRPKSAKIFIAVD